MKDRFKFRVPVYNADGSFNKLVYFDLFNEPAITFREGCVMKEPEQCTGLKDKNGKLIYEGDIVDILPEVEELGIIVWAENEAQFTIEAVTAGFVANFDNYCGRDLEVIDSIHENPELVEEK